MIGYVRQVFTREEGIGREKRSERALRGRGKEETMFVYLANVVFLNSWLLLGDWHTEE